MRFKAKVDANQQEIVAALRAAGASVLSLAAIGNGAMDLLVGFRQACYCLEVKDGRKSPSKRQLTPDQVRFHATWQGHLAVVTSVEEALKAIGVEP